MAIALIATAAYSNTGGTSNVYAKPTGTLLGHLIFAFIGTQQNSAAADIAVTPPDGTWTAITSSPYSDSAAGFFSKIWAYWKVAGGSEPANYTFTASGTSFAGIDGWLRTYSGTDTVTPINAFNSGKAASVADCVIATLGEVWVSGEWYVATAASPDNATADSSSPTLGNTSSDAGASNSFFTGDLIPGSAQGTETITHTGGWKAVGVGFSFKPAADAPTNLTPQIWL